MKKVKCEVKQSELTFITDRKATISGSLFTPVSPELNTADTVTTALLIAPATGIKRQFYTAFAQYLTENGFGVLTFDNEGIGDSKQGKGLACLKKSDASLITWGRSDMTAALRQLQSEFPNAHCHLIGHSAGGQLFGLMDNHNKLTSVFNVASSSGRIANMKPPYKKKAKFFMDVFIPANNLLFGYTRTDKIGMGEPLPRLVAKNWRDWCNGAGYIATAFDTDVTEHYYNDVSLPAMWINAPDDDIANDDNVADMVRVFPHMQTTIKNLNPADYGLKEIGHMKFFSRKSQVLWDMVIEWVIEHKPSKHKVLTDDLTEQSQFMSDLKVSKTCIQHYNRK